MAFSDRTVSFQGVQPQLESTLVAHSGALEAALSARGQKAGVKLEVHQGVGTLTMQRLELQTLTAKVGWHHLATRDLPRLLRTGPRRATELYYAVQDWLEPVPNQHAFERWLESLTTKGHPPRLAQHNDSYFLPAWVRLEDLEHAPSTSTSQATTYLSLAVVYWKQRIERSPLGFEATLEELQRIETHPTVLEELRYALSLPLPTSSVSRPTWVKPRRKESEFTPSADTQFNRFVARAGTSWAVADHSDFPLLHFPRRTLEGKVIHFRMQLTPDGPVFAWLQTTPQAWFGYLLKGGHAFLVSHQNIQARRYIPPEEFIDALLRYRARLLAKPLEPGLALYSVGSQLLAELETALQGAVSLENQSENRTAKDSQKS